MAPDHIELGDARAWCFRPAGAGDGGPGVLMLPITAGEYEIETLFARYLAGRGHTALLVQRREEWLALGRPPADLAVQARATLADARAGLDWLLGPGQVAPHRLGLVGISLGAFLGGVVAGTDRRVQAAALLLGGSDLPEVLRTADDGFVRDWRVSVARPRGLRERDLGPLLHEALDPLDPGGAIRGLDPARILMATAVFDRVVRPRFARNLWEAAGRPPRLLLPCGHYSAILFLGPLMRATGDFLDRTLGGTRDPR